MHYVQNTIDRSDHLRKDDAKLSQLLTHADARFYPIHKGQVLTTTDNSAALSIDRPNALTLEETIFLGIENSIPCFAFSCKDHSDDQLQQLIHTARAPAQFNELRSAGPMLEYHESALLAYARALVGWQDSVNYCEHCGSGLRNTQGGHVKKCLANDCGRLQFPRTDPAVIMLVELAATDSEPARCLLGRNPNWPPGVFSTLAGFVEPGETLEHAVAREVYEESRIRVTNVRYMASQPWPFPRSIMLGFVADAQSDVIECDPLEIEEAHWFSKAQLAKFGDWGDDSDGAKLPRQDSIARYLINHWISSH